ncbi:class I SAM-dependent methyltransferase [soil metagenome]
MGRNNALLATVPQPGSMGTETRVSSDAGSGTDHKARVRSQFGSTAADYVSSPKHRAGADLQRLVELAGCGPDDVVLDIATGGGHTALALAPHVAQVVASDLTPKMLEAARGFIKEQGATNVSFEIADAEKLPFEERSFTIVSCRIAPHHFGDVQAFCNEVARVLKPGGRFVLMDSISPDDTILDAFINELEWRRDTTHVRSYSLNEWRSFIEHAGLTVEQHEFVQREHEYETWTSRSRMTAEAKAGLDRFVLSQPDKVREFFGIRIESDHILSFTDHKVLITSTKR